MKIADFGLARLVGEPRQNSTITASGLAMGTPQYMAPEQIEHPHDVDQRADIYSLGVVFYEMLTGELPIGRFAPPSQKSAVDPRVDEVVLHALEKEPEKRYRSARELKTGLEAIAAEVPADIAAAPTRVLPGLSGAPRCALPRPATRPFWWTVSAWLFVGIGLLAVLDTLASLYARPVNPAHFAGTGPSGRGDRIADAEPALAHRCAGRPGNGDGGRHAHRRHDGRRTGTRGRDDPGLEHLPIPVVERPRWAAAAAIVVAVLLVWPAYTLLSRKARALFNQTASK